MDDERWEAGMPVVDRRGIGALRRKGPRSWGGLLGRLAGALFVVLVVGCAPQAPAVTPAGPLPTPVPIPIGSCALLVPRELPSGAAPGPPRLPGTGGTAWGIGDDALVLVVGEFRPGVRGGLPAVGLPEGHPQRVKVRGVDAEVFLVGDDGVGSIGISWLSGDCPYTLWLADGTTIVEAADYAVRF